jgi:hypothetical protein
MQNTRADGECGVTKYADAIDVTMVALLLLALLADFVWVFGSEGGRYALSIVLVIAGLIVCWGWWKLVASSDD